MSLELFLLAVLAQRALVVFLKGEAKRHRKILLKDPSDEKDK